MLLRVSYLGIFTRTVKSTLDVYSQNKQSRFILEQNHGFQNYVSKGFKRSRDGISLKQSLQIRSTKANQKNGGVEKQEAEDKGAEKVNEQ